MDISPVAPAPLPELGFDGTRSHSGRDEAPGAPAYGNVLATYEYSDGKMEPVTVEARAGDWNHLGHVVKGSLADAVRVAREDSVLDTIDMPELASTAILQAGEGVYHVVPVLGFLPGQPADDEPTTNLPVDVAEGDDTGPGGIWDELGGYGRPGLQLPEGMDSASYSVVATPTSTDLVALVGLERWINFGGENAQKALEEAAGK